MSTRPAPVALVDFRRHVLGEIEAARVFAIITVEVVVSAPIRMVIWVGVAVLVELPVERVEIAVTAVFFVFGVLVFIILAVFALGAVTVFISEALAALHATLDLGLSQALVPVLEILPSEVHVAETTKPRRREQALAVFAGSTFLHELSPSRLEPCPCLGGSEAADPEHTDLGLS